MTETHELDLDATTGENGAVADSYEGIELICPNCRERTNISVALKTGHCIQCKMDYTLSVEYGDREGQE